jgi:hypothetical protein
VAVRGGVLPGVRPGHSLRFAMVEQATAALRASGVPYLHLAGDDLDPNYRQWLGVLLPAATVEVWPRRVTSRTSPIRSGSPGGSRPPHIGWPRERPQRA